MEIRTTEIADRLTDAQRLLCQVRRNHLWDDWYKTCNDEDLKKLADIKAIIDEVEKILNEATV